MNNLRQQQRNVGQQCESESPNKRVKQLQGLYRPQSLAKGVQAED